MRRIAASAAVLFAICWAILIPIFYWGPFHNPARTFSVAGGNRGYVVSRLPPGSQGERAGLRLGQTVDVARMPLADRYRLLYGWWGDRVVNVPVSSGRTRFAAVSAGIPNSPPAGAFWPIYAILGVISSLIAAGIVARRPGLMTAAFAFYCLFAPVGRNVATYFFSGLPDAIFGPLATLIQACLGTAPILALLPFIARFPTAGYAAGQTRIGRVADAAFIAGTLVLIWQAAVRTWPVDVSVWTNIVPTIAAEVAVLVWCASRFSSARGDERRRIGWALAGLGVSAIAYATNEMLPGLSQNPPLYTALVVVQLALPFSVAYAILRHRVMDISFALNRSIIFGIVTVLVVVVISFVDWLASRLISERRLALAVEALVSVGFGVTLSWLHARVESIVDRVLFSQRHRAESQLEMRISALDYATSESAVDEAVVEEAARILSLESAAIFRVGSWDGLRRTSSLGWGSDDAESLEVNDLLVRTLLSLESTVLLDSGDLHRTDFPAGHQRPDIAIPILLRHKLIGIVLYGRRAGEAALDPEERRLVERLVRSAAIAYDAVESTRWRSAALSSSPPVIGALSI